MSPDRGSEADDALLNRLLAGDERAFSELVATYHGSLLRLALTFVRDRGAAEDVVQEAWLGVIKGLSSFERRSSLKTWIFRILANRARTRGARDGRFVNFSAIGETDEAPTHLADRFSAEGRWLQPPSNRRLTHGGAAHSPGSIVVSTMAPSTSLSRCTQVERWARRYHAAAAAATAIVPNTVSLCRASQNSKLDRRATASKRPCAP